MILYYTEKQMTLKGVYITLYFYELLATQCSKHTNIQEEILMKTAINIILLSSTFFIFFLYTF